jgi:hypothetical protein
MATFMFCEARHEQLLAQNGELTLNEAARRVWRGSHKSAYPVRQQPPHSCRCCATVSSRQSEGPDRLSCSRSPAWGQAPKRTEAFVELLPGGNYLLKALARIDLLLWPPGLGQRDLAQEDLQEDLAHEDEWILIQEEYFRDILRGYSPTARLTLPELGIAGDQKYVLDEEWKQYFRDGLVETTHSGRGGVRPEVKELIGRLLDEFSTP